MSAYPFWPSRVKRPPPAAAAEIAEKGGALVKFYGTHDHLHCLEVEAWGVGVERGWTAKPSMVLAPRFRCGGRGASAPV